MHRACAWVAWVVLACCAPAALTTQGGAAFREVKVEASAVPLANLVAVCWPPDATSSQRVTLTWLADDVVFEVKGGASNSTGRCMRELAVSRARFAAPVELSPPSQPVDAAGVFAWVKALSPSRFGAERGLLDPGPLVQACLARGGGLRAGTSFVVRYSPELQVRVVPSALTEAERCVEAVLGSTVWPSPREVFFEVRALSGTAAAASEVDGYFAPTLSTGAALDPTVVKEAVHLLQPKVAQCWNAALLRRPSISGARTFRFRVENSGAVSHAWVASGLGEGPIAVDYVLDRCLVETLKSAHFPPQEGDGLYTWLFASR